MTNERINNLFATAEQAGQARISVGRHSAYCATGAVVLVAPTETVAEWRIVQLSGNTGSRRERDETILSGTLDDIRAALAKRGPSFQVGPGMCRMW